MAPHGTLFFNTDHAYRWLLLLRLVSQGEPFSSVSSSGSYQHKYIMQALLYVDDFYQLFYPKSLLLQT